MKEFEDQEQNNDFRLRAHLRDKQANMLAFMYNVQYQIAAEKFDQKFQPYSELKIIQKSQAIKTEEVTRILNALSQKLHERILRQSIECDRALNKLETLWQKMKIQPFHRYYVEKYLYSTYLDHLPSLIKNEDLLIRKQQHIYFSILRAIWARQACLNQISRQLKKYSPQDMYEHFHTVKQRETQRNRKIQQRQYRVHGYRALYRLDQHEANLGKTKMEQLFQDINNYRKLTVHVIDLIKSWKEYICSLTHDIKKRKQRIQYYYQERNYLLWILNDSKFIANTFLINFYSFSLRNDPFLLRPILSLQTKMNQSKQLSFQQLQLYQLIQVKPKQIIKIMASVEHLYHQLQTNIRNRKIFHSSVLNKVKSMSLEPTKGHSNPEDSPIKKIKLDPIKSQKSVSLKRDGFGSKQLSQDSMTKSNIILRKPSEVNKPTSTLYGRSFNSERINPFKMIQSDRLISIKEEVFKKVKEDLEYQTKKTLLRSKEFEELIDLQVRKNMNEILQVQKRELSEAVLQVTPISCKQEEMSSYLAYIYKLIPVNHLQLQIPLKQLSTVISDQSYSYLLKISNVSQEIGYVIGKVNRQIKGYKSIDILLVAFKQSYLIERIILRVIEFIWKYQTAKEVVFTFRYSTEQNQQLLIKLKEGLSPYSTLIQKKINKLTEIRFIFVKKGSNQNHVYNPYPQQLHFKLYCALSTDLIKLDSFRENQQSYLYYQYILMEMLKRFTNSEDFMILRDTFKPKDRLRHLLKLVTDLQGQKKDQIAITALSADTASDLNEQLTLLKKPHLQLSDLTSINSIKMLLLQLTLTPSYSLKVVSTLKGQKMHRYHINSTIDCFNDEEQTEFFVLDVQEAHYLKILIFKADRYLKQSNKSLYRYLSPRIQKRKPQKKFIENLWVEMIRYPSNPNQQDSLYLHTFATDEFASINKHLYISDYLDWYSDIQIQNGLQYSLGKGDVHIARPLGVGVLSNSGNVLYCRILQ